MRIPVSMVTAALVIAVAQGATAEDAAPGDRVVVTVNGEAITVAEIDLVLPQVAAEFGRQGLQPDQQQVLGLATDRLVDTKLLAQEARRQSIELAPGAVEAVLGQIEQQVGGREALEANLATAGVTYGQLSKTIGESELAQQLVKSRIAPGIEVSDQEVQDFYTSNPQMFETPEQVHARHILITVEEGATEAQREEAMQRAGAARQRALDGEDFAELASELSEGPSASEGGDLGFFTADRMVEAFSQAAFALEPGSISEVVETRFGYHVIKVEERRTGGVRPLSEVQDGLRRGLESRALADEVNAMLVGLREKAEIVPAAGATASPAAE